MRKIISDPPVSWYKSSPADWVGMADWLRAHPGRLAPLGECLADDIPQVVNWFIAAVGGKWKFAARCLNDSNKCSLYVFYPYPVSGDKTQNKENRKMGETTPKEPPVSWSHNTPRDAAQWEKMTDWMKTHPSELLYVGTYLVKDVPQVVNWLVEKFGGSWGFSAHPLDDISKCVLYARYENSPNQK